MITFNFNVMNKIVNLFVLSMVLLCAGCTKEHPVSTGDIQGIVTESGNGTAPLSGVRVNILSNGTSATTGSDGQFSFRDLEAGSYKLQFMKEGYEANMKSVSVIAGQKANCDMQLVAIGAKMELGQPLLVSARQIPRCLLTSSTMAHPNSIGIFPALTKRTGLK